VVGVELSAGKVCMVEVSRELPPGFESLPVRIVVSASKNSLPTASKMPCHGRSRDSTLRTLPQSDQNASSCRMLSLTTLLIPHVSLSGESFLS
jgi:hypothetical protein